MRPMAAILLLLLAACGAASSDRTAGPNGVSPSQDSPAATTVTQSPGPSRASAEPSPAPAGRFARVLGVMDCPGGCPSFSVSRALTQPGADVDPILVDGFLVVDDDGTVLLCDAVADTLTGGCAGERLLFDGQGALELLAGAEWSEELQLLGTVHLEP